SAGVGDDARGALSLAQRGHLVVGAANLECPDRLQVFGFQIECVPLVVEREERGANRDAVEASPGGADVVESDHFCLNAVSAGRTALTRFATRERAIREPAATF